MDKQAFDLVMKRFDSLDSSIGEVKGLCNDLDVRTTSLEGSRIRQRAAISLGGFVVTIFSTVCSWLAAK